MKYSILKTVRLLLAVSVLLFPVVRSIATKGGFESNLWVYAVELVFIITLAVVHKAIQKRNNK